ncbi:MAG: PASTA domain-containing protein [Candidatus Margulisiibacteriota bacterium]
MFNLFIYLIYVALVLYIVDQLIRRERCVWSTQLALGVVAIAITPLIISWLYTSYVTAVPETHVPYLVSKPISDAEDLLRQNHLQWAIMDRVHNKDIPPGSVVSQYPEGGRAVKQGRIVQLVLSGEIPKILVPDLISKTLDQAVPLLNEAGLKLGTISEEATSEFPEGMIIAQDPPVGLEITSGAAVSVMVSKRSEPLPENPPAEPETDAGEAQ